MAEDIMRTLRTFMLSLFIVLVVVVVYNYSSGNAWWGGPHERPVGTTGTVPIETARERGAEVGERVAIAAAKVKETAGEAALTSKIKAKMVLDDTIKARQIDVTTDRSTVTLSGTVGSVSEHDRAVQLARETAGITHVIDQLRVEVK